MKYNTAFRRFSVFSQADIVQNLLQCLNIITFLPLQRILSLQSFILLFMLLHLTTNHLPRANMGRFRVIVFCG
jgi:hypothetical protein